MSRTVLITGATKWIGLALSHRLAARGDTVVGLAHAIVTDFPGTVAEVDLADAGAAQEGLSRLMAAHAVDAVVNDVGLVRPQALGSVALDDLADVLDLNLRTAVQTVQAALPSMRERGWGRIVNIASLTVLGVPERTAYAGRQGGAHQLHSRLGT